MSEILKIKGKIGELELEEKNLLLKFDGLKLSLRELLDVTERDPERIKTEIIREQAFDFHKLKIDILAVRTEAAELKRILGRG